MIKPSLALVTAVTIATLASSCIFVVSKGSGSDFQMDLQDEPQQPAAPQSILVMLNSDDGRIVATLAGQPVVHDGRNEHNFSLNVAAIDPTTGMLEQTFSSLGHGHKIKKTINADIAGRQCVVELLADSWEDVRDERDVRLSVQ